MSNPIYINNIDDSKMEILSRLIKLWNYLIKNNFFESEYELIAIARSNNGVSDIARWKIFIMALNSDALMSFHDRHDKSMHVTNIIKTIHFVKQKVDEFYNAPNKLSKKDMEKLNRIHRHIADYIVNRGTVR